MVSMILSSSTPPISSPIIQSTSSSLPLKCDRLFLRRRRLVRASSDDASTGSNQYIPVAEVPSFDTTSYEKKIVSEITVEEQPPPPPEEDPPQTIDLLQNIKDIDSGEIIPIALYGSGALVGLWLASAVVRAIDSIPLVPNLMELVGLAYTVWFGYKYLLFKENREELFAKIEELKQEVLGFDN